MRTLEYTLPEPQVPAMAIKTCPRCQQQLRFPDHIGGMLMACPTCGQEFASDFKIGKVNSQQPDKDTETDRQEEKIPKRRGGFSVVV